MLHGLGGVGKSTVALALARTALERRVRTWWISATGPGAVRAGMTALAVELGATRHQLCTGSLSDLVWRLLADSGRPWLLILDNADDPAGDLAPPGGDVLDGTGWLRPVTHPHGMVVVTTRSRLDWEGPSPVGGTARSWLRLHPLGPLNAADAGLALRDLTGAEPGPLAAAESLGRRLGGLPLALALAGQYLAEARRMPAGLGGPAVPRTYADYEHALQTGGHQALLRGFGGPGGAGRRRERELIGPTWELSLDLLAARGLEQARALLTLLACFGGDPIPFGLLLSAAVLAASPLFPGLRATERWELIRALAGQGLIEHTTPGDPATARSAASRPDPRVAHQLVLHPLVRDSFGQAAHTSGRIADYLDALTALLTRATRALDPRDPATWDRWAMLAGHATAGLELLRARRRWGLDDLTEAQLPPQLLTPATLAARYLRVTGRLAEADAAYSSVWETGAHLFGPDHADVLSVAHDLHRVRAAQGRREDAESGLRMVLDDRLRILGPEHPDTLTTQHYLGRTLRESGRHGEALRWLTHTLTTRERVLGPRHRDTLTSRNNVGDLLVEQGAWTAAEELLRSVRDDRAEVLGLEHPATLVTCYHLARLYRDRGDTERAEKAATELTEACLRVLGPDHPRALAAVGLLAEAQTNLGRPDQMTPRVQDAYRRSLRR